jgi:hypothetical protein
VAPSGVAKRRAQRRRRRRAAVADHRRLPRQVGVEAPQRAQEQTQRAALLLVDEGDPHGTVVRRGRRRVGPGTHHAVLGGEEARHQLGGRRVAGQPRVEPAEHQLHHPAA